MGKVHRLPSTDDAEREASTWFARMNADDVTPDDRARFEVWLSANTVNAKAYSELSATWRELVNTQPALDVPMHGATVPESTGRQMEVVHLQRRHRHWIGNRVKT